MQKRGACAHTRVRRQGRAGIRPRGWMGGRAGGKRRAQSRHPTDGWGGASPRPTAPPLPVVCVGRSSSCFGGVGRGFGRSRETQHFVGEGGEQPTPPHPFLCPPPHPPQPGLWGGGHRPARPRVKGGGGCGEAACPPSILWNTAGGYADGSGEEPRRFPTGSRALSWYRETMAEGSEESATPLTPGCSLRTLLRGGFTLCRTPIPHPFTSGFTPFLVCVPPASSRGRRGLDTYCNFVSSRFSFCWST